MKSFEMGVLILRIYLGVAFLIHGLAKFQGGIEQTAGWFDSIGIPGFAAYIVAFIEVVGGILFILGLGTRYISALFLIVMIGAIVKVKLAAGFMGNGQATGYELDVAYAVISLFFILNEKTSFSLDEKVTKVVQNISK